MSLPNYDEFRQALSDPDRRAQIGLVISDSDAQSLAGNEEWARNYFDSWIAMAAPAPTAVMPEAPAAPSAPFSAPPTQPFGQPGQPGGYAPAGYQTQPQQPQQGYAAAPQQGYAAQPQQGGQPFGGQSMPQGQMPKKKGLPGWAIGVIIGGAALVLLGGIGVTALVLNSVGGDDDKKSASSSQQSDDDNPDAPDDDASGDPVDPDDTLPDDSTGGSDFGLDYSQADADAFTAIAGPAYGLEATEYMDQEFIDETLITAGEAVCLSLSTGASEAELVESLDSAGVAVGAGQKIVDAAKEYLCD